MVNSNRKGKEWERALRRCLRALGLPAHRNGDARQDLGDLVVGPWSIEAKNTKNMAAGIAEGIDQIAGRSRAVVVWKRPRKPVGQAYVIQTLNAWLADHEDELREGP